MAPHETCWPSTSSDPVRVLTQCMEWNMASRETYWPSTGNGPVKVLNWLNEWSSTRCLMRHIGPVQVSA